MEDRLSRLGDRSRYLARTKPTHHFRKNAPLSYVVILLYLAFGVVAVRWCIRYSRKCGVDSTFLGPGLSAIAKDMNFSPFVIIVVIPFAIAFWPLLCLMDLSEIPKKQRLKQKKLDAANATAKDRDLALQNQTQYQSLVGETCETTGVLSPMGQVRIEGRDLNAISTNGYIPAGRQVVVTGVRGQTLEVANVTGRT